MRLSLPVLSCLVVLGSACGSDVDVGGPRADDLNGNSDGAAGAAGENNQAGAAGTGGTANTEAGAGGSGNEAGAAGDGTHPEAGTGGAITAEDGSVLGPREQAYAIANNGASCTSDSDCCVVFDQCMNTGLVVGATDKDKVASLLSDALQTEKRPCTRCVSPLIQVSCSQGKCVGTIVPDDPGAGGGAPDPALRMDHCGGIGAPSDSGNTGQALGCAGG
jgi:hypothetical protein